MTTTAAIDPVALARTLIRCPSVTPEDAGVLGALENVLRGLGFECRRLPFAEAGTPDVDNLYARIGSGAPHFCFAGHTDVVPVGDLKGWTVDPFAADVIDGVLYGRGAADMKGAIAAFVAAAAGFLERRGRGFGGSISLMITNDEEGPSINGTAKMVEWLHARGETIDACIVGEPTSERQLGDMIKIGRRGSLNAVLTVKGVQGHVAYPHLADNPNHRLVAMLTRLTGEALDEGSDWFQPSSLQITSIDVGNPTTNLIPGTATARINVRFSDQHRSADVIAWMRARLDAVGGQYDLAVRVSGESFLTPPGALSDIVSGAIGAALGRSPKLSTTGGTSDARFIRALCPVLECGLVGQTMHKVDERAPVADIEALARVYGTVLDRVFAA